MEHVKLIQLLKQIFSVYGNDENIRADSCHTDGLRWTGIIAWENFFLPLSGASEVPIFLLLKLGQAKLNSAVLSSPVLLAEL